VNVEIQVYNHNGLRDRILEYAAGMVSRQVRKGEPYGNLRRSICVVIADFDLIEESTVYRHRYFLEDVENSSRFSDKLEIDVLELTKLPESERTRLADWMRFLKADEVEEMEDLAKKSPYIEKAVGRYMELTEDERTRMLAEMRERAVRDEQSRIYYATKDGLERGREEGRAEGRTEGRAEGRAETARCMKAKDFDIRTIAECTGLTEDEVAAL